MCSALCSRGISLWLGWPSMHSICTMRKLKYLSWNWGQGISPTLIFCRWCWISMCHEGVQRFGRRVNYTFVWEPGGQVLHHQGDMESHPQTRPGTPATDCFRAQTSLQDCYFSGMEEAMGPHSWWSWRNLCDGIMLRIVRYPLSLHVPRVMQKSFYQHMSPANTLTVISHGVHFCLSSKPGLLTV